MLRKCNEKHTNITFLEIQPNMSPNRSLASLSGHFNLNRTEHISLTHKTSFSSLHFCQKAGSRAQASHTKRVTYQFFFIQTTVLHSSFI